MNPMISYTDSCNCSDSSDIELNDEWVGKKSPKLSRGSRSRKRCLTKTTQGMGEGAQFNKHQRVSLFEAKVEVSIQM